MWAALFILLACVETIPNGSREGEDAFPKYGGRKARYSPTPRETGETASNIHYKSNGLFWRMHKKGYRWDTGTQIEAPLADAEVLATTWYQDRETFNLPNNRMLVNAVYQLREAIGQVSVSGREMAINTGRSAVASFAKTKMAHVKTAIGDMLGDALHGSNASGKEFDGFGLHLSAASTVGGIAPADVPDWIAQVSNAAANTFTLLGLQSLVGKCTQGDTRPTLLASNQATYDKFWTFGAAVQVIVDQEMASIGIRHLNFNGIPYIVDSHVPGSGSGSTDNQVDAINENYIELWVHPNYNFTQVKYSELPNEDVTRWGIKVKGNVIGSGRPYLGVYAQINPAL